ncbi:cadherin-2-like [Synchiropus picturatus]
MVEDKNKRPVFTQQEYCGTVPELSPPGTQVITMPAIQADRPASSSAMLLYSIIEEESIPASTGKEILSMPWFDGKISTIDAVPGREVVKAFRLRLKVTAEGGNGLTDEAVAIITVSSNHVPKFSPTSYHMTAVENSLGDVGRVNVTDGDEPGTGNWEAKYSFSGDPHGYFSIRTDDETNQPLDFETVEELNLILHVENINPLSSKAPKVPVSTATVIVTVLNENDAPFFTEDPMKIVLPENVLPCTSLMSIIAVDPENMSMRFDIIKDPEDWIKINDITGEISAKRRFDSRSVHVSNKVYTAGVKVMAFQPPQIKKTKEQEAENQQDNVINYNGGGAEVNMNDFSFKALHTPNTSSTQRNGQAINDLQGSAPQTLSAYTLGRQSTEDCLSDKMLLPSRQRCGLIVLTTKELSVSIDLPCTPSSAQITDSGAVCKFPPDPADTEDKVGVSVTFTTLSKRKSLNCSITTSFMLNSIDLSLPSFTSESDSDNHTPAPTAKMLLVGDDSPDPTAANSSGQPSPYLMETEESSNSSSSCGPLNLSNNGLVCELLTGVSQNLPSTTDSAGRQAALTHEDVSKNNGLNLGCNDALCALAKAGPAATEGEQDTNYSSCHRQFINSALTELKLWYKYHSGTSSGESKTLTLKTAKRDSTVPSLDMKQIYKYEGDDTVTGSLSSSYPSSSGGDHDFHYPNEWGPQFQKLADLYISQD